MGSLSRAWSKLHQPRAYLTVEPVLFLFMFASFLSYTVFQEFLHHLVCQRTHNCTSLETNHTNDGGGTCNAPGPIEQQVQTEASHWLLYFNLASGIPAILVSIFYGAISDQKGRRLFIILPSLGSIVNQTVLLVMVYFQHTLPLSFLLLGAFAYGIGGNISVVNFAVYSYVSDVSAKSKRTMQISILESMTFLGATASLLIGGWWVHNSHFRDPLFCVIGIQVLIILYVIVALPESIGMFRDKRCAPSLQPSMAESSPEQPYPGQLSPRQYLPCGVLRSSCMNLLAFLRLLFTDWKLIILMGMFFVIEINFLGINDTVILFSLGRPLCWGTEVIGYFLASKVFLNGVAALLVLPFLSLIGLGDVSLMVLGLVSGGAGLVIMGLSSHTWMMFVVPPVAAMRGCVVPIIRSMLSKLTPIDKQGIVFSGVSVVEATCTIVASVIYNSIYPVTREVFPGLVFFLMAAALLIPLGLILILELIMNRRRLCWSGANERTPLLEGIQ